jgi:hypothetical protein
MNPFSLTYSSFLRLFCILNILILLGVLPPKIIPYAMIECTYEKYNILKALLDNIALTALIT